MEQQEGRNEKTTELVTLAYGSSRHISAHLSMVLGKRGLTIAKNQRDVVEKELKAHESRSGRGSARCQFDVIGRKVVGLSQIDGQLPPGVERPKMKVFLPKQDSAQVAAAL